MLTKLLVLITIWWIQGCASTSAASGAAHQPPPDAPDNGDIVVPQDVPPDVSTPQLPAEVNDLLDRLEKSAADLQSFTAEVQYQKEDALLGRKELRTGDLIYRQHPETRQKSFAILFENEIVQNIRRNEPKHYIFDGRWLAEIDHKNKQFIKREVVAPGKQLDPLKLGEGPFPLPVGQPKAEVLARFDVTKASLPDSGLLKNLQDVEGLSLVPKAGAKEAKDYAGIELFYDKTTLLPIGINISDVNGDRKTVKLLNVKRNAQLTDAQLKRLDIAEPNPREWKIDVRPWSATE